MTVRPADNPFASRRIDGIGYRFGESAVDELLRRLRAFGGRGAIVGPHGSGKTTLLEEMASELDGTPVWIRLDRDTVRPMPSALAALPSTVGADHVVLIDGAEQLGALAWWRLAARLPSAGTVIITGHRSGRLPTIHQCTTSPELLAELVEKLAPGTSSEVDLEDLFNRHDGNIRLCFRNLYDRWAGRHR